MKNINLLCLGCMREKPDESACPYCKFDLTKYQVPVHHLRPEKILNGKYLVGKALGEGGFGITYIGWDLNLDFPIAIKEYFPNGVVARNINYDDNVFVSAGEKEEYFKKGKERFLSEARTLAKFRKTIGIVSVQDFFSENGTVYIIMEYIEGEDFKHFLKRRGGKLPPETVFKMMRPVMEALIEVHSKGLIHRDISPDNIMVLEDLTMKLLDFGAAREISGGEKSLSVILKPGYAPEEQYRTRGKQGPWTDVYALCATIYCAITGVKPTEAMERVMGDDVKTPSELGILMNPKKEKALMKGMNVLAQNRWQSVKELYDILYLEKVKNEVKKENEAKKENEVIKRRESIREKKVVSTKETVLMTENERTKKTVGAKNTIKIKEPAGVKETGNAKDKREKIEEKNKSIRAKQENIESKQKDQKRRKNRKKKKKIPAIITAIAIVCVVFTIWMNHANNGNKVNDGNNKNNSIDIMHNEDSVNNFINNSINNSVNNVIPNFVISAQSFHTVGLKEDGTVVAVGFNETRQCEVGDWKDIVAISAGGFYTAGLKKDGTVVAVGQNADGECEINDWKDIIAISTGENHTVGLKKDGTVIAVGKNEDGQCEVNDWEDIVAISAGDEHTVGLKKDGTVIAAGKNEDGQCEVNDWEDIVAVSAGRTQTVGLKQDGTVVAVGYNIGEQCKVNDWKDIVAISAGSFHIVGLKKDGTVVATGQNGYGQCEVNGWEDIVVICAGGSHTVGLKEDGTVIAVGENADGQCEVSDWENIKIPGQE